MEVTKAYLEQQLQMYEQAAQKHRDDAIANGGAADSIRNLLKAMSVEEIEPEKKP